MSSPTVLRFLPHIRLRLVPTALPRLGRGLALGVAHALGVATGVAFMLAGAVTALPAQYFGRNKVPYERFRFDVLRTTNFDLHYYAEEREAARDAARMLERWNARLAGLFGHTLSERKPVILYADQPDFQQTNVISQQLDEGTGGVTESLLDRMALPLTGSYAENDHVLGHEAVHVFQYDIAQKEPGGYRGLDRLPLWLIEGMAEYMSVGGADAHTAMWLRDAVLRKDIPTIRQLTTNARYFPYRYGEALWAFIGGTWGDEAIPRVFRRSLKEGFEPALRRELGISADSISLRWRDAIQRTYGPLIDGRARPRDVGEPVILAGKNPGEHNVSPAVSPDGRLVAFFSTRGVVGVELLIADAVTGEIKASLATPRTSSHFDALSWLYSAGSWSPDGRKLAVVTYADGDNEIDIFDLASKRVERRIHPKGVGAITTVAWSPDGSRLAFSGMDGGISDLYLYELSGDELRRLTNDRNADLQPAWSPDGTTLAFATDRADPRSPADSGLAGSDFDRLRYAPLRLALLDVASGDVRVLPGFARGKHINPQFSADGRALFFVSDHDGFSEIYRLVLDTRELFQVTRVATGVSGIAASSPAISVARLTGRLLFSVFENAGSHIAALPAERTDGASLGKMADGNRAGVVARSADSTSAAALPTVAGGPPGRVAAYLRDHATGLPAPSSIQERNYHPKFRLASLGQPSLGMSFGGVFGTQVVGGASAYFTDMLGDHAIGAAVQASGTMRDLGGQFLYINSSRRWNWGLSAERIPYLAAYASVSDTTVRSGGRSYAGTNVDYVLARIAASGGSLITQFARSATRRFELSAGYTNYNYSLEVSRQTYVGTSRVGSSRTELPAPSSLGLVEASAAYVGDDAFYGFTSPISGTRYRFQVTPTLGSLAYQTLLLDYRRYFLLKPVTFAVRGLHYGRYGRDADSDRLGSVYLGDGALVRGYAYDSFDGTDCTSASTTGSLAGSTCPQFDRLFGSRAAVANAELRIPLIGARGLGLVQANWLPPIEIAPFVDAGVTWTGESSPVWALASNSAERTPVMSTGISSRVSLFGFAVLEIYYARPFQRPTRGGVFGFALQPGW